MAHTHIHLNQVIVGGIIGAIVFFGGGYYAGKAFAAPQGRGQAAGQFGQGAGGRGFNGRNLNGFVSGTILSKDDTSITVKLGMGADNASSTGSRIVILGSATQVGKFVEGSAADLAVGSSVSVTGTPNADGSITAQQIMIRPAGQSGPGFGGRRQ